MRALTAVTAVRDEPPRASDPAGDRLRALRARPAREHEARTFLHDAAFRCDTVKVLPGEYYVHDGDDLLLTTVLGSCVAACLIDRGARLGGMNHFMLPDGGSAGRFGAFAMELLINELMKRGARRERLEAKVFGGAQVMPGFTSINVGERNVTFVERFLATERIPIVSRDVRDVHPRRVCLFPASGRALCRKLASAQAATIASEESALRGRLARPAAPSVDGSVELF